MSEKITITLTGRRPVTVTKELWPVIARSFEHDGQVECQANRRWTLLVRQCQREGDDRCIVYGIYDTQWQNESDRRAGEIVENLEAVPEAVYLVADRLGFEVRLADECIADLPSVDLDAEATAKDAAKDIV